MRNNKKGFTIVELVIVIAVIAILAAVLIPTFAGVITKAQESAAHQKAAGAHKVLLAELTDAENTTPFAPESGTWYFIVGDKWFELENGVVKAEPVDKPGATEVSTTDAVYYSEADLPVGTVTKADGVKVEVYTDLGEVVVWNDKN